MANPPISRQRKARLRNLSGPLTILLLIPVIFVYSRTTVQAAKTNAARHREADGGSISWRNEALRRHGALEKPRERGLWEQLWAGKEEKKAEGEVREETPGMRRRRQEINPIEESLRKARDKSGKDSGQD